MPRGASPKREREYNELKHEFRKEHRYRGREEEVAARIVNKQRSRHGETRSAKGKDRTPDRNLPLRDFDQLTVPQVTRRLPQLSHGQLEKVKRYEQRHNHRKTLLQKLDRALAA